MMTPTEKVRIKTSSEFDFDNSTPHQISIWEAFGEEPPSPPENITFSVNCIDDWPLVSQKSNRRRDFHPIKTKAHQLEITAPAGYYEEESGEKATSSFVGEQEWKLFIVLRKMALMHGGHQLDGDFALAFSFRELARFYKESTKKNINHSVLRQRLEVLRTAVYQVQDKDQSVHFSLLRELFISSKSDPKKNNGNSKCVIMFDRMTEKTLTKGNGTLIDYDLACELPHLASWIYAKLERAGLEAGIESGVPYKLWLKDTLYRVGLDNSKKTINVLKKELTKALTILIERGVLRSFSFKDKLTSGRGRPKLIDSEISLVITEDFSSNIKLKLFSNRKLRIGKSDKINGNILNSTRKLTPLSPVKVENGYIGHYPRNPENDPRKEASDCPADAEWRDEDRRENVPN